MSGTSDIRDLYDVDLSAWAEGQADRLRERRLGALDRDRLSTTIERLGRRERRELRTRLGIVLTGLLRWAEQVDLRCHGWAASLDTQRHLVARLLADNTSLRPAIPTLIAEIYPFAKTRAVLESGLFDDSFSEGCPFLEEEILMDGFYPDPYGDDAVRGEGWWKRSR